MKRILFLDRDNACLSQMAETFTKRFGREVVDAHSAGTEHASEVDGTAMAVLRERGLEVKDCRSKNLEELKGGEFDLCVDFGCWEDRYAGLVSCKERRSWDDISSPQDQKYSNYRRVREEVGGRVMALLREFRKSQ